MSLSLSLQKPIGYKGIYFFLSSRLRICFSHLLLNSPPFFPPTNLQYLQTFATTTEDSETVLSRIGLNQLYFAVEQNLNVSLKILICTHENVNKR